MIQKFSSYVRQYAFQVALMSMLVTVIGVGLSDAIASPVNVNSASQSELESIKGLGPSKARAIISEREDGGFYRDANDLQKRVRGIGMKSVEKMVDNGLTIESPSAYRETRNGSRASSRAQVEPTTRASRSQGRSRETQDQYPTSKRGKGQKNWE
jgi:competence ComEA-like helix-hairpin-helix protein